MNHHNLIEKHLADGLTDEELVVFERTLFHEPDAARHLVAAARLEEQLVVKLGAGRPEPSWLANLRRGRSTPHWAVRWRHPRVAVAALMLVSCLAAAVVAWIRSDGPVRPEPTLADPPAADRPFVPARVLLAQETKVSDPLPELETPAMVALRKFLSSYYLTNLQLETPRPLGEALERLLQRAREVNHRQNPTIERSSAELAASDAIDVRSAARVSLPTKHISLMEGLKWIAAMNRSEVFLKEPGIITFRPWETEEVPTLATEVLVTTPYLLTRPADYGKGRAAEDGPNKSGGGPDAFGEDTEAPAARRLTPVELFQSWGIVFTGEATADFDEATASLTIRQTASTIRMIKELLAIDETGRGGLVSVTTKILEYAQPGGQPNELMTAERFQVWLKAQNQATGVNLLATPEVVARSGQRALIEIIREVVRPEVEEVPRTKTVDWQGLKITVEPVLEGEVISLVGAVDLRLPVDRKPGKLLAEDLRAGETAPVGALATTATDFEGMVPDGQTALFLLNDEADGPHVVVSVTVHREDRSGK